jgi:microsomal dipeptidase-like Zn-dependent dipeptidase
MAVECEWTGRSVRSRAYTICTSESTSTGGGYGDYFPHSWVNPKQIAEATEAFLELGYPESAIRGILGGNRLRIAEQVWK